MELLFHSELDRWHSAHAFTMRNVRTRLIASKSRRIGRGIKYRGERKEDEGDRETRRRSPTLTVRVSSRKANAVGGDKIATG